jgi:hypothetical protein
VEPRIRGDGRHGQQQRESPGDSPSATFTHEQARDPNQIDSDCQRYPNAKESDVHAFHQLDFTALYIPMPE